MQHIERIYNYLKIKGISAYEFERKCGLSNGYLNSRKEGTRGLGSEILEKIAKYYIDLNLIWVITGAGNMLIDGSTDNGEGSNMGEKDKNMQAQSQAQLQAQSKKSVKKSGASAANQSNPLSPEYVIQILQSQVAVLNATVADKSKIIEMLHEKLSRNETGSN